MKGKRLLLVVGLIVILLVGWMLTMQAMTGVELKEKQNQLTAEADIYAEKELYIRAIPLYEEALSYKTDLNTEIEEKLLKVYRDYGDSASYLSLVAKRIEDGSATEEEYITAADYYIASRKLEDAMDVIKKGIAALDAQSLVEYYEANRYNYTMRVTKYEEIVPTVDNEMMPAFDGENWLYIDADARVELSDNYDTVTPFNSSGYAVVSRDGKYFAIVASGAKYGVDEVGVTDVYSVTDKYILAQVNGKYSYYDYDFQCRAKDYQYDQITANACGLAAVKKGDKWGIITDVGNTVVDFTLDDVAVNSLGAVFANNVAMVKSGDKWYLIDTQGNKISDKGFANAKAPEASGYIAVADENGMWGFIDQQAQEVIACQYQDALSFSDHLAAVKIVDTWGYISENNVLVIDEILEDAQPFHNGIAQAKFVDGTAIIKLSYFEE